MWSTPSLTSESAAGQCGQRPASPVNLQQVNVVNAQSLEALVHALLDVAGVHAGWRLAVAQVGEVRRKAGNFRGNDHLRIGGRGEKTQRYSEQQ